MLRRSAAQAADALRAAARRAFFDPTTGTFGNGSQGSYATAIEAGILTGAEAQAAGERLVALIRARGNRVSSGFATTRSVVSALTTLGRSQVIYDILLQPAEPGVGAMLTSGPGTFWECWWIDPTNTGTGSLNHVDSAGHSPPGRGRASPGSGRRRPGTRRFRVAPQFVDGVTRLELRTETVRGEVAIRYSRNASTAHIEVTVPRAARARWRLAGRADAAADAGHARGRASRRREDPQAWLAAAARQLRGSAVDSAGPIARMSSARALSSTSRGSRPAGPTRRSRRSPGSGACPSRTNSPSHAVLKSCRHDPQRGATLPRRWSHPADAAARDEITFVYALIDQCMEVPQQLAEPLLLLHLSNGETRQNSSTGWPAGWNRVAVETAGLGDDVTITAIEVGLEYGDTRANNALCRLSERE